ncbi:tripartite motif-containing protein 16-like [Salarias fasciatus]|uniref:tripartite motif-containing protein 16-like n=1 Tax=Salarias fasciatus TaxID=181472 RepID=UPI001176FE5C|nr:tripartite motif-containing protein 16-like [Salarias fasciatus]
MEENKKTSSQSGTADHSSGADVPCDACSGKRKRKAEMFCRLCLASFCETHLKDHCVVPQLKKHKLIPTSAGMKESFCRQHKNPLQIFCRTDRQLLCWVCALTEHGGHDVVQVQKQTRMQAQLDKFKQEIQNRMAVLEGNESELAKAANSVRDAAWKVCDDFEQVCKEQVRLFTKSMEAACFDMRAKVGQIQKSALDKISRDSQHVKREASELQREENKLCQLSQTLDRIEFLQGFYTFKLPAFTDSCERSKVVKEFVTAQENILKAFSEKHQNESFDQPLTALGRKDIKTKYRKIKKDPLLLCDRPMLKLDSNTAANGLHLSDDKKEMSFRGGVSRYRPERFTHFYQALCEKGLRGAHYWEVMWDVGVVDVAVSYKNIGRKGSDNSCCFGHNEFSWKLQCGSSSCTFWHNNFFRDQIPPVRSRRLGVHLDYHKGTLGFYSVSESHTKTLLHQTQTTFTQPLFPGFSVDLGATLTICNI